MFLFGNKTDPSGSISKAQGVEEEFKIAVKKEIYVVPIGCTGSMSEDLHGGVICDFSTYYPVRGYKIMFRKLSQKHSPDQVAKRVVEFVKKLRSEA